MLSENKPYNNYLPSQQKFSLTTYYLSKFFKKYEQPMCLNGKHGHYILGFYIFLPNGKC